VSLIRDFRLRFFHESVVDTGDKHEANHREFSKKFEMAPIGYSGASGELIQEKTSSRRSRVRLPLMCTLLFYTNSSRVFTDRPFYNFGLENGLAHQPSSTEKEMDKQPDAFRLHLVQPYWWIFF
jgi:hypothetical protein